MRVFLKNGEEVVVNDHVYCSPSWAVRDGTPYSVARIMEFLLPEGIQKGSKSDDGTFYYDRVRLAWYYRPGDVSDRPVADSRVLLAAIYSEICDINQLRAKCHVIHRDKIVDLAAWKRRPDRFYFTRLFDPYIKREFEVIPTASVQNLPVRIRDTMIERYEYIVAEKEVVQDLTDALRICDSCEDWCSNFADTVQCDRCKKHFHMACVQPPLTAKPARGYGWTCAPCSRRHEEEVDSRTRGTNGKPKSSGYRSRGRARKFDPLAPKEEDIVIKHFKMWPFRYFGQHTIAEDTLDPDDLIFPRTASRVGPRYQATVSIAPGVDEVIPEPEVRGGEDTIELLSNVHAMDSQKVAELLQCMSALTREPKLLQSVDWLTEMVRRYSQAHANDAPLNKVTLTLKTRTPKWKTKAVAWMDKEWTKAEIHAFEESLNIYGAELRSVKGEISTRSIYEVVRFYGQWKSSKVGEENAAIRAKSDPDKPRRPKSKKPTNLKRDDHQEVGISDDEGSVMGSSAKTAPICGACRKTDSTAWWKAPKGLTSDLLCDTCGTNWRKYADLNIRAIRDDTAKAKVVDKREGTPLQNPTTKRAKLDVSAPPSPPFSKLPQLRCVGCLKNGPKGRVIECSQCHFRVHAGVCGVKLKPHEVDSWVCELCQNDKTLEASVISDCLLCPPPSKAAKEKEKYFFPPAESFLRACKPTEGKGWTHLLCSVFMPEISFTDADTLRLVEGISVVPQQRWQSSCVICRLSGGAVVKCSDCTREYHVSCAWKAGHRFGFEIQPVKNSRREMTTMARFNDHFGLMHPVIQCREHGGKRDLHEICAWDEETGQTALETYCKVYKLAPVTQAHGLLRKARRLDQVLQARTDASLNALSDDPPLIHKECHRCHTEYSPFFHSISPSLSMCHRCHWEESHPIPHPSTSNGVLPHSNGIAITV